MSLPFSELIDRKAAMQFEIHSPSFTTYTPLRYLSGRLMDTAVFQSAYSRQHHRIFASFCSVDFEDLSALLD